MSNFQDPPPLVHLHPKLICPPITLDFGRLILHELPPTPTLSNKPLNNNRIVHENKRNENKSKTKSRHIQIDHAFYCSM